jgi:esterase/lipase superfamily enzyme
MPFIFPVDIAILGRRSAAHSMYLANLISQLPPEQRVAVLGHSHGARATVAALHLLGGGALENGQALPAGHSVPRHLRAVLIAAAIDHQWLNPGERYGQALVTPERVLLMRNSRDATLGIYPLRKGVGPRALGQYGLGQDDRFILGSLGAKVDELDAAEFAAWHHRFAAYHEHPELASAIVPYVYFQNDTPAINGRAVTPPQTSPVVEPAKPAQRAPDIGKSSAGNLPLNETGAERSATPFPRRNAVQLQLEP